MLLQDLLSYVCLEYVFNLVEAQLRKKTKCTSLNGVYVIYIVELLDLVYKKERTDIYQTNCLIQKCQNEVILGSI